MKEIAIAQQTAWINRAEIAVDDKFVWTFHNGYGTSGSLQKNYMPLSHPARWGEGRQLLRVCNVYEGQNGYGPFVDYWLVPETEPWSGKEIDCLIINGPDAFKMKRQPTKTRFKDKHGNAI